MKPTLTKLAKAVLLRSPFREYFFPRYTYNFSPPQLCFLCQCVEATKHVDGFIAEVGCATGYTTVFLNRLMDVQGIEKTYYAMDTFSGFVAKDIDVEVTDRGKKPDFFTGFQTNKKKWFDATMRQNGISRVRSIEADVNEYDLTTLGPLSFVLLDVDLYRPMKKTLPEIYEVLSPGGIIVVDDCSCENIRWDGAYQAYREFAEERGQPLEIVHGKLGVVRKNA